MYIAPSAPSPWLRLSMCSYSASASKMVTVASYW